MSETADKTVRLSKVAREFNQGLHTVVEFLAAKGFKVEQNPNAKIGAQEYDLLQAEYGTSKAEKEASKQTVQARQERESVIMHSASKEAPRKVSAPAAAVPPPVAAPPVAPPAPTPVPVPAPAPVAEVAPVPAATAEPAPVAKPENDVIKAKADKVEGPKTLGKIDLDAPRKTTKKTAKTAPAAPEPPPAPVAQAPAPAPPPVPEAPTEPETIRVNVAKLTGVKSLGKIELPVEKERKPSERPGDDRGRRKRIVKPGPVNVERTVQQEQRTTPATGRPGELDENAVKRKVSETLARLTGGGGKGRGAKVRREKRDQRFQRFEEEQAARDLAGKTLKVTEFVTASELASMMSVPVTDIIKACFALGMMVSINQRLDAETLSVIAEEYGFKVEFVGADNEENVMEEPDAPERVTGRAPIVTVMGHVDHGKTSLLDYIRRTKVATGEAGGITQHIGAYHVETPKGVISFLDTPGHAAFTSMRARGAKLTDIVVLVVAADDGVMPQTIEAIKHARAAKVPIIVAMNKMDKADANPDHLKQGLANHEVIPEDWGGDTQFVPMSAKTGMGVDALLDAISVQAEVLELKAVPEGRASGVVIESALDKGRGPVATVLVQQGTLSKGDYLVCGTQYGRVRALFDETSQQVERAGPSIPVVVLGLSGVPDAGDDFVVVEDERLAKDVAQQREAKRREHRLVKQAGNRMEDIMAQMGQGEGQQTLNLVIKADVQGSVEALRESLTSLSNERIRINVITSGVGGITESDATLAAASKAVVIGFNVRADASARRIIESNGLDLRYFSIIYDVIDQVKQVASGLLGVEIREEIIGTAEVREVFRSSKFGAVAGSMVVEGTVKRNKPIRVLRNNTVIFQGELESLRRYKEIVDEVRMGTDCGIAVKQYNDVKPGDMIECFERIEVQRTL